MSSYHLPEYWDQRYRQDTEPFEWYQKYDDLKPKIRPHIPDTAKVLVIGCGSSQFSFDLYDDGVHSIDNIDISSVVIDQMKARIGDRKGMTFEAKDCCELDPETSKYDVVFDKGTIDALLCGEGGPERVGECLSRVSRMLTPGGAFISVSYGNTDMRMFYFDKAEYGWEIAVEEVEKPKLLDTPTGGAEFHYVYICRKK